MPPGSFRLKGNHIWPITLHHTQQILAWLQTFPLNSVLKSSFVEFNTDHRLVAVLLHALHLPLSKCEYINSANKVTPDMWNRHRGFIKKWWCLAGQNYNKEVRPNMIPQDLIRAVSMSVNMMKSMSTIKSKNLVILNSAFIAIKQLLGFKYKQTFRNTW